MGRSDLYRLEPGWMRSTRVQGFAQPPFDSASAIAGIVCDVGHGGRVESGLRSQVLAPRLVCGSQLGETCGDRNGASASWTSWRPRRRPGHRTRVPVPPRNCAATGPNWLVSIFRFGFVEVARDPVRRTAMRPMGL